MMFDLSSESVRRSYQAGDVVAGELEFVLPPKTVDDYWGRDSEFAGRLKSCGASPWQAVYDEYRYNSRLNVSTHRGTLLRNYPVEIQASIAGGAAFADFTVSSGGIGHVPVIVKGVPSGTALQAQRYVDGLWVPLESVDIARHNYYQGYRNTEGTMDCVFNIDRPNQDLQRSWRVRILGRPGTRAYGFAIEGVLE